MNNGEERKEVMFEKYHHAWSKPVNSTFTLYKLFCNNGSNDYYNCKPKNFSI